MVPRYHETSEVQQQTPASSWARVLSVTTIVLIWLGTIPRLVPLPSMPDRGIFVSVGERLLAGDTLYSAVWDNKDPLFYYSIALGRAFSPFADAVIEFLWLACASLAVVKISGNLGVPGNLKFLVGLGLTPLVLTGVFYYPGYTHLPGTAILFWVLATANPRRVLISGALLAVLLFLKIVLFPVAAVLCVAILVLNRDRRVWKALLLGFGLAFLAIVGILAFRGELVPYLNSILLNAGYSQSDASASPFGSVVGHLSRVITASSAPILLSLIALSLVSVRAGRRLEPKSRDAKQRTAYFLPLISLITSLIVLGMTGLWDHHGQILYVTSILTIIVIARWLPVSDKFGGFAASVIVLLCSAFVLGGTNLASNFTAGQSFRTNLMSLGQMSPETKALLDFARQGTYARAGSNDDVGHAFGLANWTLSCPRFHQYSFDSAASLAAVVACLPKAEAVVVSQSLVPVSNNPVWNHFVDDVESLMKASYRCSPIGSERLCIRRTTVL